MIRMNLNYSYLLMYIAVTSLSTTNQYFLSRSLSHTYACARVILKIFKQYIVNRKPTITYYDYTVKTQLASFLPYNLIAMIDKFFSTFIFITFITVKRCPLF